jgi:hypothetical protein
MVGEPESYNIEKNDVKAASVERLVMPDCVHNARSRSANGFYCRDCATFFSKDTPTYRSGELLSSIWMVLHNINVDRYRKDLPPIPEVASMIEEIGIGKEHDNYEDIIFRAENIMKKFGKNSESAMLTLKV